jgi:hypothetical protein
MGGLKRVDGVERKDSKKTVQMSSSKKICLYRDITAGVYLSEAQNDISPYLTHCIRVYSLLIYTGKGGVEQREGLRGNSSQSWV